jgi:HEAT repeat protein
MFREAVCERSAEEVPRYGKVLLLSTSPERRAECARWLGASGCSSAYAYLRQALWDADETVRVLVVEAVGELAIRQSGGELAALFAWSGPRVRRSILRAVSRIGYLSEFDGLLSMAVTDPDRRVRALAARTLTAAATRAVVAERAVVAATALRPGRA